MDKPKSSILIVGHRGHGKTDLMRAVLAMQAGVVVMDDLVEQDYSELELRIVAYCGSLLGNVRKPPKCHKPFEGLSNKFNQTPEKSTFTRKINRSTKRW